MKVVDEHLHDFSSGVFEEVTKALAYLGRVLVLAELLERLVQPRSQRFPNYHILLLREVEVDFVKLNL